MGSAEDKPPVPPQPSSWLLAYPPYRRSDNLATQMVISDTRLQQCRRCVAFQPMSPGASILLGDPACTPANAIGPTSQIPSLMDYASQRPANILIPPASPPSDDEKKEEEGVIQTEAKVEGPSSSINASRWSSHTTAENSSSITNLGGGGLLSQSSSTLTHESTATGITTTARSSDALLSHPGGLIGQSTDELTLAPNEDFRDKFPSMSDMDLTIAKAEAEAKVEGAVAEGEFGSEGDVFSGSGSVLGGEASAKAAAEISTEGAKAGVEAVMGAYLAKGEVKSDDTALLHGKANAEVLSAEAKAEAEVVLTPEEATLSGALKAEALLGQIEGEGTIEITPKRVGNSFINAWNFVTDDDVATLGDDLDWGIKLTLGASASVGAQAEVGGEATASAQSVGAKGKAKLGLGLGVGVTAGAELTGLDKAWGSVKSAGVAVGDAAVSGGRWVGGKAASGWNNVKQGWNNLWD